ncbi:MAG: hypothetical protein RR240_00480 [Burkholderiaceae bacterium]
MYRSLFALALPLALASASATAQESFFSRALSAINETTPVGLKPAAERSGWLGDAWDGMTDIAKRGSTGLVLPAYTIHPAWDYPNRHNQNGYTWGGGLSRSVIDERGNERLIYAIAFSDSHYDIEPFIGYAWLARWPLGNTGLYGGLGYSVGITMRSDFSWLPVPAPVPLASIGTNDFGLYATYVPISNVAFIFAKAQFDDTRRRGSAPVTGSAWSTRNLLYAGGVHVKTDQEGIDGITVESGNGPMIGYRHFVSRNVAIDVNANRSQHSMADVGQPMGRFDLLNLGVAAQYHIEASDTLRLHAGLGLGYWRVENPELGASSLEQTAFAPLVQAGATWALTRNVHLTGGLTMGFPRLDLSRPGEDTAAIKPSPANFNLGLGMAW